MTPVTLNAILNTAPIIIQGATKLLKMMRQKTSDMDPDNETLPVTVEGLKQQIIQIEARLLENYESDVEQIRLIEELAKQNEALAETLRQTFRKLTVLTYISLIALATSVVAVLLLFLN